MYEAGNKCSVLFYFRLSHHIGKSIWFIAAYRQEVKTPFDLAQYITLGYHGPHLTVKAALGVHSSIPGSGQTFVSKSWKLLVEFPGASISEKHVSICLCTFPSSCEIGVPLEYESEGIRSALVLTHTISVL